MMRPWPAELVGLQPAGGKVAPGGIELAMPPVRLGPCPSYPFPQTRPPEETPRRLYSRLPSGRPHCGSPDSDRDDSSSNWRRRARPAKAEGPANPRESPCSVGFASLWNGYGLGGNRILRRRVHLAFPQRRHVIRNSLFFVQANVSGVCAHESFVKDSTRQLVELFFFQSSQHAGPDLGAQRNIIE
jgi:hypothetical protein